MLQAIPVIFVTALTQQENESVGLELGAVDYIPKPCNPSLVRLRVRNQLELKRQRDQLTTMNALLEERVRERTAALEGAVQELEHLCYAISHDLRSPLRHINSFSAIILERCGETFDDECNADFARISAAANKMDSLVDALLNLPRLWRRRIVRETVNLSALATEIMSTLCSNDPQRSVKVQIADTMTVQADRALLRIALEQLLDNAWKFSAGTCPAHIECGCEQVNGRNVYYVRDNGVGFDMAYAHKLFGIFQRLHLECEFSGIGMGLAIVQRIIASHGGEIWAEGAVGAGATFRFTVGAQAPGH
jgi:light-regulated signal transduction histidine kinase (bacteriophytochrome)